MVSNITYLEAEGNYVKVHTKGSCFLVSRSLKYWEDKLPEIFCPHSQVFSG